MEVGKALLETILASVPSSQPVSVIQSLMPSASAPSTSEPKPPPKLSTTIVTKPPPIPSIKAFNAQLTISSKDLALRNAADVFKAAADGMERSRVKGEKYWVDALKIRRANWGLIPAPLPFGAPTGKGADRTSKDFLISFGLEECTYSTLMNRLFPLICHFITSSANVQEACGGPYAHNS